MKVKKVFAHNLIKSLRANFDRRSDKKLSKQKKDVIYSSYFHFIFKRFITISRAIYYMITFLMKTYSPRIGGLHDKSQNIKCSKKCCMALKSFYVYLFIIGNIGLFHARSKVFIEFAGFCKITPQRVKCSE